MQASGTQNSGPAIMWITQTNISTKGRSVSVASVADVAKSRTDSNSRIVLAKAPADCGRFSSRDIIACRNSIEPSSRSAFLPALSMSQLRRLRARYSNSMATITPLASAHSVV